jgi:hypothetical protein
MVQLVAAVWSEVAPVSAGDEAVATHPSRLRSGEERGGAKKCGARAARMECGEGSGSLGRWWERAEEGAQWRWRQWRTTKQLWRTRGKGSSLL